VIDKALQVFSPASLRESHTLTYPLGANVCQTPLSPVPRGEPSFLFGVGPNFDPADEPGLAAFEEGCQRVFSFAREVGGSVYPIGYPVGTPVMDAAAWHQHFSHGREPLSDALKRYDPDGRLGAIDGVDPAPPNWMP
jgi:hypothetical protein